MSSLTESAKKVTLIRHAQSEWNRAAWSPARILTFRCFFDPMISDPRITAMGENQVSALRHQLGDAWLKDQGVELIVVTPYTRALQTCIKLFPPSLCTSLGVKIVVTSLHAEIMESSGDIGRRPSQLRDEFPELNFDGVEELWWYDASKGLVAKEPRVIYEARVTAFREWLVQRPEKRIVCVGHGHFWSNFAGIRRPSNCAAVDVTVSPQYVTLV